ncbi:MAG: hypothetical protein KIT84_39180 [Labilithrix sp.]|nr:hypothetical protein [Labilithrix sp.]MCW5817085.1 hypothetical protein [Labilithrix sp.]
MHRSKTAAGDLVVWAEPEGDATLILAAYEKKRGEAIGAPVVVRRTSGRVTALDVVVTTDGNDLAVAWASVLEDGQKGHVSAVVFGSLDLKRMSKPATVELVMDHPVTVARVAMVPSPRGGVVVAHESKLTKCLSDYSTPKSMVDCPVYEAVAVTVGGGTSVLGNKPLDVGPGLDVALVPFDDKGLLLFGSGMHGGRTQSSITVPWTKGEAAPTADALSCSGLAGYAPEYRRGEDGEVVCIGSDMRFDEAAKDCARPAGGDKDRCLRARALGHDGKLRGNDDVVTKVECAAHKQKLTLRAGTVTLLQPSSYADDFLAKPCR